MTGWVAAVGQTILMLSDLISARVEAQPCPVSPRPWRKMSEAVCLPRADSTTLLEDMTLLLLLLPLLENSLPIQSTDIGERGGGFVFFWFSLDKLD